MVKVVLLRSYWEAVRPSGDEVWVTNGRINEIWQSGHDDLKAGRIGTTTGSFTAVAIVTDAVCPGVAFANFLWPSAPANSVAPRVPDPVTNRYRFKLGKARVTRTGDSPYKRNFTAMSFAPRHIV